ncbi:hypothetical protein [Halomicrobium katesii]|uniref:hypothetical protein n=1 Tax=Halomicrobium katesii TaxID=437163 RepID=UPI000379625D|nr:hypothetical protein [Halomicrobium katesii]
MDDRTRESLLWGVVGTLSFLVLVQGYELLAAATVTVGVKAGVALVVGVTTTTVTTVARDRLLDARRRPAENESP